MANNLKKDDGDDLVNLSLSCNIGPNRRESPQTQMQNPLTKMEVNDPDQPGTSGSRLGVRRLQDLQVIGHVPGPSRSRRDWSLSRGKSETITPPFPWATNRRAKVHSLSYLLENNIETIKGNVKCKKCKIMFERSLDLKSNLVQLLEFIQNENGTMRGRAAKVWLKPVLPKCNHCGQENSVQPYLEYTKKRDINWLFLLLSQMLCFCTATQLIYFLKHTKNHRTGPRDRLLYATYVDLCNQLVPEWSAST